MYRHSWRDFEGHLHEFRTDCELEWVRHIVLCYVVRRGVDAEADLEVRALGDRWFRVSLRYRGVLDLWAAADPSAYPFVAVTRDLHDVFEQFYEGDAWGDWFDDWEINWVVKHKPDKPWCEGEFSSVIDE